MKSSKGFSSSTNHGYVCAAGAGCAFSCGCPVAGLPQVTAAIRKSATRVRCMGFPDMDEGSERSLVAAALFDATANKIGNILPAGEMFDQFSDHYPGKPKLLFELI